MKRIAMYGLAAAFLGGMLVAPGTASAQSYNENTGCGLGNMLFKNIGQDSILFQILAVTTNGIVGNQTFGISSGTLGCSRPAKIVFNEKVNTFVAANMDDLARDMSRGQGETLDTLAELMSIPSDKKGEFYAALQTNFKTIYGSEGVQASDVVEAVSAAAPKS